MSMLSMFMRNITLCICVDHQEILHNNTKELDETADSYNRMYLCIGKSAKSAYYSWHQFSMISMVNRHFIKNLCVTVQLISRSLVVLAYTLRVSALSMISFYRNAPGNAVVYLKTNSPRTAIIIDDCCFFMCKEMGRTQNRGNYVYCLCRGLSNWYRSYIYGSRSIRNTWQEQ